MTRLTTRRTTRLKNAAHKLARKPVRRLFRASYPVPETVPKLSIENEHAAMLAWREVGRQMFSRCLRSSRITTTTHSFVGTLKKKNR
jgi:hypothetical protein